MDTNDKINRMLGKTNITKCGMNLNRTNSNLNLQLGKGRNITNEIVKLLDKLPEVKSAKGNIVVVLDNGQKKTLQLSYTG